MDAHGRVGGVRFEVELRVGRLVGKVEPEGRVGRARMHEEGAARVVFVRRNQSEPGEKDAVCVRGGERRERPGKRSNGEDSPIAGLYLNFGRAATVVKRIDRDVDGGVARLNVEGM